MQTNQLPTLANATLPAHIVAAMKQPSAVMTAAMTGLSTGGALRLVANQGRFRVKDGTAETILPDLFLDVVVVGAIPGVTKNYYAKAYVPGGDNAESPDCYSLMGDVPDSAAPNKQSSNCAACPQNQWGSKISPTGNEIKACSDYRRLAIIAADDPDVIYQANVPPASLKLWAKYLKDLSLRGVDISMVKTRLSLDNHLWTFAFAGFVDADMYGAVSGLVGSPDVNGVLGLLGRSAPALPAPAAAAVPAPAPTPAPAPAPQAEPAPAPEPAKPARGFGKKNGAAQPAAEATVTVATGNTGLAGLENELAALLNKRDV